MSPFVSRSRVPRGRGTDSRTETQRFPIWVTRRWSKKKSLNATVCEQRHRRSQERGWQCGQYQVPRPATRVLSIAVPQRLHGSPPRP